MLTANQLLDRCWRASRAYRGEEMSLLAVRSELRACISDPIPFPLVIEWTPRATVAALLRVSGHHRCKVAYHLMVATLAIRFPKKTIPNFSYSAADGDFQVGGTAFHVTVAPSKAHAARCAKNLRDGLAAFLIVDQANVDRARYALEFEKIAGRVAVESVESFVGQNLSELAEFTADRIAPTWGNLLRTYARVSEVETDGSLLIEVPSALGGAEE